MKIVGKTDGGYLAQITEKEIGVITGFGLYPDYGSEAEKAAYREATGRGPGSSNRSRDDAIPTNTEIAIVAGVQFIERLREKALTAKTTAGHLRELADMLENLIPVAINPDAAKEPKP